MTLKAVLDRLADAIAPDDASPAAAAAPPADRPGPAGSAAVADGDGAAAALPLLPDGVRLRADLAKLQQAVRAEHDASTRAQKRRDDLDVQIGALRLKEQMGEPVGPELKRLRAAQADAVREIKEVIGSCQQADAQIAALETAIAAAEREQTRAMIVRRAVAHVEAGRAFDVTLSAALAPFTDYVAEDVALSIAARQYLPGTNFRDIRSRLADAIACAIFAALPPQVRATFGDILLSNVADRRSPTSFEALSIGAALAARFGDTAPTTSPAGQQPEGSHHEDQ